MKTLEMYNNIIAALCVWREARGEIAMAKLLVAVSIVNRAKDLKRWPNTLAGVVLQPKQFSSFNIGDPNASKVPALNDASFVSCCTMVDCALAEVSGIASRVQELDVELRTLLRSCGYVNKSMLETNHYHDDSIEPPSWTKGMQYLGKVGKLLFYKG